MRSSGRRSCCLFPSVSSSRYFKVSEAGDDGKAQFGCSEARFGGKELDSTVVELDSAAEEQGRRRPRRRRGSADEDITMLLDTHAMTFPKLCFIPDLAAHQV